MSLSESDLLHVARLARLRLGKRECAELGEQIERILGYVEKLQELDVSDVPPTKHVLEQVDVLRADATSPSLDRDRVMEQAPEEDDGRFVVPSVMAE